MSPTAGVGPLVCPTCGTPAVAGAHFCFHCGMPLQSARPQAAAGGTERRVVTVLFGDLSDFTAWAEDLDPERVGEVTDRVLAALARAVDAFGGHVDKLTGDGIMAVFGAPTAHEDDAERAVRAAAAMQSAVRRLVADEAGGGRRLGLRVGLNTGVVLAGVQAALSYTVVGDTVNTASRLSDAAGVGAVLAGRETVVAARRVSSWRALAPLRLKGKREPVVAYELLGLHPEGGEHLGLGFAPRLVARDAELGRLIGRLVDVVDRSLPATVVVSGEAGVGKTRLVKELGRFAGELPGARVLWGRAAPYGEGRHLAPLAEIVRMACGIPDDTEPADAAERVRRSVARLEHPGRDAGLLPSALADRLLGLLGLPEVAGVPPREPAATGDGTGSGVSAAVEGVTTLLRALAAEGPLVVCVDDMQWANPALTAALTTVGRRLAGPTLLVLCARDRAGEDWSRLPQAEVLELAPLSVTDAERLLRGYLDGSELDAAARVALLARAQGNPFFLSELLHLLVDRGLLRRVDGSGPASWVLSGPLPEDALPAGVRAVLAARIDGLDPAAKSVLRSASVFGTRFPADALPDVEQQPAGDVQRALAELVGRGLVREPEPGEGFHSFPQPMARDVTYDGLTMVERARRHALAAEWAAGSMRGTPGEVYAVVASQAEQAARAAAAMELAADDPARTARALGVEAFLWLGQAALGHDEHREAADLLARGRRLGDRVLPPDRLLPLQVAQAEALASMRRLDDAERELLPVLAADDPALRAAARGVLGDVRHKQGRDAEAAQALVTALAEAAEAGRDDIAGAALRQLGLLDLHAGRLRAAQERFHEALTLARRVGDARGAGWALQHIAWSATTRGDYPAAAGALQEASEVFAALEDTGGLAWCAGTEALVRLLQGRLAEAREIASALIPVADALGEHWGVSVCLTIDALAAAELGDVVVAAEEAGRAVEGFTASGDSWGRALALIAAGAAARAAAEPARGVELLQEAVSTAGLGEHPLVRSLALVSLGFTALDAGELALAEQCAEQAVTALAPLELEPHAALGARVLSAQVHRARGEHEQALAILEQALGADEAPTLLFPRRQALAHLAGVLLACGRPGDALAAARRAVAVPAQDVRARVLALRALGSALRANGQDALARQVLAEALQVAVSTTARSEVATTQRILAGVS